MRGITKHCHALLGASVIVAGLVASAAGCAARSAEAPLAVKLGIPRDQARAELRAAQFCGKTDSGPQPRVETLPRCERAAAEWGDAWVVATYEQDALVELRRFERYADDARAMERWNELVTARTAATPATEEAAAALRTKGLLEPGTRAVKAFRVDADTVVGVFLLTPQPPQQANLLELVIRAPR